MLRLLNQGRGLSPISQKRTAMPNYPLKTCTLRIRQRRGFDFSSEFSTSPLQTAAILLRFS